MVGSGIQARDDNKRPRSLLQNCNPRLVARGRKEAYEAASGRSSRRSRSEPLGDATVRHLSEARSRVGLLHLGQNEGSTRNDAMSPEWGFTGHDYTPFAVAAVNIFSELILVAGSETGDDMQTGVGDAARGSTANPNNSNDLPHQASGSELHLTSCPGCSLSSYPRPRGPALSNP